jgi:zinc transport system ATP-binding protein
MSGPAVRFSQVNLSLGGTSILENVSLAVRPGTIHCLIGPNGGGKSSLVRALLGEMPTTGEIAIEWNGGRTIGYVPQSLDFDRMLPVSVNDFMAVIGQRRPAFLGLGREQRRIAAAALERVGLAGKERRKLGDLSGGERQRLLLAQALVPKPSLLLLDEPLSGMDEVGERLFESLVLQLAEEGATVLWIAHDLAQVRRLADHVTCLNRSVRFDGVPEEVLTSERVASAFGMQGLSLVMRESAAAAGGLS